MSKYNPSPELNDLVREAFDAQEAFDMWDEGATFYHRRAGPQRARKCTLDEVVREMDAANLKLVEFVQREGTRLSVHLRHEATK